MSMKIVNVPSGIESGLWLSDLHFPKQNTRAINKAISDNKNAGCVVLGGDILDNAPFGRHGHKPEDEDITTVFDAVSIFLQSLRNRMPNAKIYWLEGNHDKWFSNYIQSNARVLQNDKYFTIEGRLGLKALGITYLPETDVLKFQGLYLHHGHVFYRGRTFPGVPAKSVFQGSNESVLTGHVHRESRHKERRLNGEYIECYTTGCLSELNPNYSPFAKYEHGYATFAKRGKSQFSVNLISL